MNIQFEIRQDLEIQFEGKITINDQIIRAIIAEIRPPILEPPPVPITQMPPISVPQVSNTDKRLAYTMKETAEILGVSYITDHRLIKWGLLKCSPALRHKIIPKFEIERFLKQTDSTSAQKTGTGHISLRNVQRTIDRMSRSR